MNVSELFWIASAEEISLGYTQTEDDYICLLCGKSFEKGIIYQEDDGLYEAERFMRMHIKNEHGSVFEYLVNLDKKLTGLTEHQKSILKLFHEGKSDSDIQKEMGIGSASTIRNHRFGLKEREKQSKATLAIMELLGEKNQSLYDVMENSKAKRKNKKTVKPKSEEFLKKYFPEDKSGPLKLEVFIKIAEQLENDRTYTEKEINQILSDVSEDYITLRRYLIEYGFLGRKPDGSQYWLSIALDEKGEEEMDRKKELKQAFKEIKVEAGVYQIRNTLNGKIYVTTSRNMRNLVGRIGLLENGTHMSKELNKEWKEYGKDAFVFEVLELLEKEPHEYFDVKDELKKLEQKWLKKLQPFGDKGYNKETQIKE